MRKRRGMYTQKSSKRMFFFIGLLSFTGFLNGEPCPLSLPPGVDGTVINQHKIGDLLHLWKQVEIMHIGDKNPDGSRYGLYEFEGKQVTIKQLAQLEENMKPAELYVLDDVLEKVKEDLIKAAVPFMQEAQEVKPITKELLHVWADLHGCYDSCLLEGVLQEPGTEVEGFNRDMTSFHAINRFCQDLISFISDLIKSCPCAMKRFQNRFIRNK